MSIAAQLIGDAVGADGRRHDRPARRSPQHERGRLRLGVARRRARRRASATRNSATACLPRCSASRGPRSPRRRTRPTVILVGPDIKEELPVLYLRLRDAVETGPHQAHRVLVADHRHDAVRVAHRSSHAAGQRAGRDREGVRRSGDRRTQIAHGRRRRRRRSRATWRRPRRPRSPRVQAVLDAVPARDWCCRRSGAATSSERSSSAWRRRRRATTRSPPCGPRPTARSTCSCCSVPTRSTTAPMPTSRRRALAGAAPRSSRSTRSCPSRPQLADVVLPAAVFGEQTGTHDQPRRSTCRGSTRRSPRHGTSRPDWMIAAELALHLGHDLGFGSHRRDRPGDRRRGPGVCARPAVGPRRGTGGVSRSVRRHRSRRGDARGAPSSYDYRLVVSRKLYDQAVPTAMSPSLAKLADRRRRPRPPARPRPDRRSRRHRGEADQQQGLGRAAAASPTPRCSAARLGAVQPGGRRHHRARRRRRARHRRPDREARMMPHRTARRRPDARHHRLVVAGPRLRRGQGASSIFVDRARRHDVHGVVRAQDRLGHAEPHRPEQGRAVRHPADARRRHQVVLQGRPAARAGRQVGVPARAVPRVRAGVPDLVGDPARRRLHQRPGRHRHVVGGTSPASSSIDPPIGILSCSRSARSACTASCSPAGRRDRSTRCSARCARRRR